MKNYFSTCQLILCIGLLFWSFGALSQFTITLNSGNGLNVSSVTFEALNPNGTTFLTQTSPTGNANPRPNNVPVNIFSMVVGEITNTQASNQKFST